MAHGRYVNRVVFGGLVVAAWFSTASGAHRSDKAVRAVFSALLIAGVLLLLVAGFYPRDSKAVDGGKGGGEGPSGLLSSYEDLAVQIPLRVALLRLMRKHRLELVVVVACILLRVEALRLVTEEVGCSRRGVEAMLLPLLMVMYDYFQGRRTSQKDDDMDSLSQTIFEEYYSLRGRYLLPIIVLCYGIYLNSKGVLTSTYICVLGGNGASYVPISQVIGVFLDAFIILITWRLVADQEIKQKLASIGTIAILSVVTICFVSISARLFNSSLEGWTLSLSNISLWSTLTDGIGLATIIFCIVYSTSEIRLIALITMFVFSCVYASQFNLAFTAPTTFPPRTKASSVIGFFLIFTGFSAFMHIYRASEVLKTTNNFAKRIPSWLYLLLTISFVATEIMYLVRSPTIGSHPIYSLMYNARIDGDRWRVRAASSISLETAVREYRLRHRGRSPPPNFDKWYEFAMKRRCPVIDSYDQIDQDLLPFWGMPPAEIRRRSPAQVPGSGIAVVAIRGGQLESVFYEGSDKQWSPDQTFLMINTFAQWLPDMNIGINVWEMPRMAASWKYVEQLRQNGLGTKHNLQDQTFTYNLQPNWPSPFVANEMATNKLQALAQQNEKTPNPDPAQLDIPNPKGLSCPPSSPVKRGVAWGKQDNCAWCPHPYSIGQFVKNWTLLADLCYQPDMANLHGFLISQRAANRVANPDQLLLPIFSRSKVSGYNDILIPGENDFVDVANQGPYQKSFSEMENTLYWAGEADEGNPLSREWRGMQQQRLVHLANNFTATNLIPMLLPKPENNEKLIYENIPAGELAGLLNMEISFTSFDWCHTKACREQEKEFGSKNVNPGQEWNYRYLFDMDARGASQKFLSYLRSNAVPFRASIFRSWYDDRLTSWLHFVPQDSRLHAIHSTLAYFTGLKGMLNGREVEIKEKFSEAAFIADQGKKWAEKALRRDDAEAYLFRLLLEWGRVTDDRRNEIGYDTGV